MYIYLWQCLKINLVIKNIYAFSKVLFDKPNIAQPTIPIGAVEIISLRLPNTPAK